MNEIQSQKAQIRAYLERGESITPLEALELFGCFRLGARIYDLRRDGMAIERDMVERNGKQFASYFLSAE